MLKNPYGLDEYIIFKRENDNKLIIYFLDKQDQAIVFVKREFNLNYDDFLLQYELTVYKAGDKVICDSCITKVKIERKRIYLCSECNKEGKKFGLIQNE